MPLDWHTMSAHRHQHRWLCCWLIAALLFMQLATAAYACPQLAEPVQSSVAMADMPGCNGEMAAAMDPDQPQLCQVHCTPGSQATYPGGFGADLQLPPVLLALLWSTAVVAVEPAAVLPPDGTPAGAPPPGAPPLYLSLLVLRN